MHSPRGVDARMPRRAKAVVMRRTLTGCLSHPRYVADVIAITTVAIALALVMTVLLATARTVSSVLRMPILVAVDDDHATNGFCLQAPRPAG
jgi:hypothetical protein